MEVDGTKTLAAPESVMDLVNGTLAIVEEVRSQFLDFLSLSDPDVLAELPPLQRAESLLLLAKVRLRRNGVNPDEHPIKSELERLRLYQDKLERFIDLSNEQRQSMRDISRGEGKKIKYVQTNVQKKRKYQSMKKKSVQSAAKEFLEKAAWEFLGDNNDGFKGPLRAESSGDEEEEEDTVMGRSHDPSRKREPYIAEYDK